MEKGLNRNQIKYIVTLAMLIDHIGWAFVPTSSVAGQIMHTIGRLTGPVMAFMLVEGYLHTSNINKYLLRLGLFALISWPAFVYFEYGTLPVYIFPGKYLASQSDILAIYLSTSDITLVINHAFGVIYTLFLGLVAVRVYDEKKYKKWTKVILIALTGAASLLGDWPLYDVVFPLLFFIYHDDIKSKWRIYSSIMLVFTIESVYSVGIMGLFQAGTLLVPLLLHFYNGQPGKKTCFNKWFFYIFYPVHLVTIGLLRWL